MHYAVYNFELSDHGAAGVKHISTALCDIVMFINTHVTFEHI